MPANKETWHGAVADSGCTKVITPISPGLFDSADFYHAWIRNRTSREEVPADGMKQRNMAMMALQNGTTTARETGTSRLVWVDPVRCHIAMCEEQGQKIILE